MPRFSPPGLRLRLMVLVLVAALPAVGLMLLLDRHTRGVAQARAQRDALNHVRLLGRDADTVLGRAQELAQALAYSPSLQLRETATCTQYLNALLTTRPLFRALYVADSTGAVFCSAPAPATVTAAPGVAAMPAAAAALSAADQFGFSVGVATPERPSDRPRITASFSAPGATPGAGIMASVEIDATWLSRLPLPWSGEFAVLAPDGLVVTAVPGVEAPRTGGPYPDPALLRALAEQPGHDGVLHVHTAGTAWLYAFTPLRNSTGASLILLAKMPADTALSVGDGTASRLLIGVGAAMVLATGLAWTGGSMLVVRGAGRLRTTAHRLAAGDFGARTGLEQGSSEINRLASAIDGMAEALERRESGHRQVEQALRESEARFRTIVEHAPDAIVIFSPDTGDVAITNRQAERLFGLGREQLLRGRLEDLSAPIQPDGRAAPDVIRELVHAALRGETSMVRWLIRTRREDEVPCELRLVRVPLSDRRLVCATIRDVRDQARADRDRELLVQRLRLTLDAMPAACFMLDADLRIVYWNPEATRMFGYRPHEMLGRRPADVLGRAFGAAELGASAARMAAGERAHVMSESRTGDGRVIICDWYDTPIHTADGSLAGAVCMCLDITGRERAEEALRQSEENYRIIFHLAATGTSQCDVATGRFIRVNQKFCDITGYDEDELLRMSFLELTHPDDRAENAAGFARFLLSLPGEPREYSVEKRYIRKDGRVIWVHITSSLIHDASGRAVSNIAVIVDITQRKEAEARQQSLLQDNARLLSLSERHVLELQRSRDLIIASGEQLRKEIAELLHGTVQSRLLVSWHHLGSAESLIQQHEPEAALALIAQVRGDLDDVREHAVREASHALHPTIIDIGLAPAVRSLAGRFRRQFEVAVEVSAGVEQLDHPGDNRIPAPVRLAAYRIIEEALANILRHAGARHAHVALRRAATGALTVVVRDDGRGFEMRTMRTGVGLASIGGYAGQMGGHWEITSTPDLGTTLVVELPLDGDTAGRAP